MAKINVLAELEKGRKAQEVEHKEEGKKKLGNLRGGSAGILTSDGRVFGTCHRVHHLRTLGIEAPAEKYAHNMFQAGYTNEDIVKTDLEAGGLPEGYQLLAEEEIPVEYLTDSGHKVTGRPDLVYCKGDTPVHGIEVKAASSIYTARTVGANQVPKSDHLIQSGHYSYKLGQYRTEEKEPLDYTLLYTSRVNYHILFNKHLTKDFQGWKHVDHTKDRPFRVLPFNVTYSLTWNDEGRMMYSYEDSGRVVPTAITKQSIDNYYNYVSTMGETKNLGPMPEKDHVDLVSPSYSDCKYCKFADICKEGGAALEYDEFLDKARLRVAELEREHS